MPVTAPEIATSASAAAIRTKQPPSARTSACPASPDLTRRLRTFASTIRLRGRLRTFPAPAP
ncbi:MAG: hypothetical protein QM729_04020 [Solirubrobacterales bacterium]